MQGRELSLRQAIWGALRSPLPPGYSGRPTFGWLLVVLFAVQLFTGILLATYYQPSPALVDDSLRHLMRDVSWGWLMRGIHHWASHGMIVLCALQFVRFLISGAYRGPRCGQWILGLAMAALIVAIAFVGSLLVWDQNAYWLLTRTLTVIESLPSIGPGLASILRGGEQVTATTLNRALAIHAMLLPWVLSLLIGLNLWFLGRRHARGGEK